MVGYDIPTPSDPVEIGKRAYRLRCLRGMSVSDVAIQLSGILARVTDAASSRASFIRRRPHCGALPSWLIPRAPRRCATHWSCYRGRTIIDYGKTEVACFRL